MNTTPLCSKIRQLGCAERKELMEKKLVLVTWPYLEIIKKSVRDLVNRLHVSFSN